MTTEEAYRAFKVKQSQLAKMIEEGSQYIAQLRMDNYSNALRILSEKTNNETFKVQIMGSFKNGKSTLINALLGDEILPDFATPCTAVITEVKYGPKPKALLFFKHPLPDPLPPNIPAATRNYISRYKGKDISPFEVPYDDIEDYVVIPSELEQTEGIQESPYEKMELYWPLSLLENGVEIVDSPGLNEAETRTRVTMEYLEKADTVIFVMSAAAICSKTEMDVINEDILRRGFEDIHFVVNRFDQLNTPRDKEHVKKEVYRRLTDKTSLGENGIFFTSAYDGMIGKIEHDEARLEASGILQVEKALSDFLTEYKGRIKLAQPAKELKKIINNEALYKIVPQQKAMLSDNLVQLKRRYEEMQPRLAELTRRKRQIIDRFNIKAQGVLHPIERCINSYYADLLDNIPAWVRSYEVQTKVRLTNMKASSAEATSEILNALNAKIESYQRDWMDNSLNPLLSQNIDDLMKSEEQHLDKFFLDMDAVRVDISGIQPEQKPVSTWERIGAGAVGLFLTGNPLAGGGSGFSKDFAKTMGLQLGAAFALGFLGLFNPVTFGFLVVGGIVFSLLKNQSALVEKIKKNIIEKAGPQIQETRYEMTNSLLDYVKENLSQLSSAIAQSLDSEISEVQKQSEAIIHEREQGETEVEKTRQKLAECEASLQTLNSNLDDFIFQLLQSGNEKSSRVE